MLAGLTILHGSNSCPATALAMGCSALGCATAVCVAEGLGNQCDLCVRSGSFPAPAWWSAARSAIVEIGKPSVQVVPIAVDGLRWGVVALIEAAFVDGRFPVIGVTDADRAIDLAIARGAQLRPRGKVQRMERDRWQVDGLPILCGAVIGHAKRWKAGT